MDNQKGFTPVLIAFIFAIIFVGVFYAFLYNAKPTQKIISGESKITSSECEDKGGDISIVNSFLPDICPTCESCYEHSEDLDNCNTQYDISICDVSKRSDCESCLECMNRCPYGMKKIGEISDMAVKTFCCEQDLMEEDVNNPILFLRGSGGLCTYGMCWNQYKVYSNGYWEYTNGQGETLNNSGQLDKEVIDNLIEQILQTDFNALREHKFNDICPTAYDGQQNIFTFSTGSTIERIDSCETDIRNTTLFEMIYSLKNNP